MGDTHSPETWSRIHDHHAQLCRLLTAQGCPAKASNEENQLNLHFPNTQCLSGDEGPLSNSHEGFEFCPGHMFSTTSTHRGPCEPAEPSHRCRSPHFSHQGGYASLHLQGGWEGAETKVVGSSLCSRWCQGTLFRVLWTLGLATSSSPTFTLLPSLSSVFKSNPLHGQLLESCLPHCWPPLPLPCLFPMERGKSMLLCGG